MLTPGSWLDPLPWTLEGPACRWRAGGKTHPQRLPKPGAIPAEPDNWQCRGDKSILEGYSFDFGKAHELNSETASEVRARAAHLGERLRLIGVNSDLAESPFGRPPGSTAGSGPIFWEQAGAASWPEVRGYVRPPSQQGSHPAFMHLWVNPPRMHDTGYAWQTTSVPDGT